MSRPVIFVALEDIPERYNSQWRRWFERDLANLGRTVFSVGDRDVHTIEVGEFLDCYSTNVYKAKQLADIVTIIRDHPRDEFSIWFCDLWFPGIEALAYIRDIAKRHLHIAGWFHAGCWDREDLLFRAGCNSWGCHQERAWMNAVDHVYVGSRSARDMLLNANSYPFRAQITIRDNPMPDVEDYAAFQSSHPYREDIVVFPHRFAPEKNPRHFEMLRNLYVERHGDGVEFVRTKDVCTTKDDYYRLLSRAKVAFSAASQETFGIAMIEAVGCGCVPVAPDRLSYRDTLAEFDRYVEMSEAVEFVHDGIMRWRRPVYRFGSSVHDIIGAMP